MTLRSTATTRDNRPWIHLIIGIVISTVCLCVAVRGLVSDPEVFSKSKNAFSRADYRTLVPIMLATVTFYGIKAIRWRLLLLPIGNFRTVRDLFPYVMIGFGLNNLLPVHMGEVVRVLLFARRSRVKASAVATSIVFERTCDSIAVLTLLSVGLLFIPGLNPQIRTSTLLVAAFVAVLVVMLLLYVFWIDKFIEILNLLLSRVVPASWLSRLKSLLLSGATGLNALKQPRLLFGILALSLASWFVNGLVIHLALWSFGLPSGLLISCIVLGLTAIGAAIPSAPGYIGVIQVCFMTVLSLFTDDHAGIFAASVYYHMIEYVMVTLAGIYYLNTAGVTLSQVHSVLKSDPASNETTLEETKVQQSA